MGGGEREKHRHVKAIDKVPPVRPPAGVEPAAWACALRRNGSISPSAHPLHPFCSMESGVSLQG